VLDELEQGAIDDAISRIATTGRVRLGYLTRVQTGITVDGKRESGIDAVTLPYLRVANVQASYIDLTDVAEMSVPRHMVASSRLQTGDVLMTEGGDLDKLGRGTVWRSEIECCLHQNHVFAVRPVVDLLLPEFLALLTRASFARRYFERTGNKTTNLASTSSSKIRDFRVPVPDTSTQRAAVKEIDERLQSVANLEQKINQQVALLAERRQALITAAVTGQIDATSARGANA
jgi:type I restriction enzyme S subunit